MKKIGTYKLKQFERDYYNHHKDLAFDGRHVGRVSESWWAETSGGIRQPENAPFDVLETSGLKTEVRSAIKKVSFAPSKEVGQSRKVTEDGFISKLKSIDRFLVVDSRSILDGYVDFYVINKDDIHELNLGKGKSMKASKFWGKI